MNNSDPANGYEADGSPQFQWEPAAIAGHPDEQKSRNLSHIRKILGRPEEVIEEIPPTVPVQPEQDMGQEPAKPKKARNTAAFGRFVKTELYDVFGDRDVSDVTDPEKTWMHPEKLAEMLFTPPSATKSKDTKYKTKADDSEVTPDLFVNGVPLNPYEYRIIPRSPEHIGRSAVASVLSDNDISDEKVAASRRGRVHVIEKRTTQASEHLEKLRARKADVRELAKEARTPGFAHKTPERMKELFSAAWNEFTTILDVVHVQRGWDDEKRARAETALISYLTVGDQRRRVEHWQGMISLSDKYLSARISVFNNRINEAQRKIA